jgi:hypothetical protein
VKSFLRRKFKMSKKLLNEAAVRRFMGLAGMQANIVSNTVTEMYNKDEGEHEEKKEMDHPMEEAAHEERDEGYMMKEEDEDMAPVEDEMAMDTVEEAPEMEITSEEAEVLANVLQKLMAARDGMADEPEAELDADIELADDDAVEAEEDEEDAEAMMEEKEEEMNEDEIVQEVARRVAARILKAKKAQKEMNEALGK